MKKKYVIYADGACSGNGAEYPVGGWACTVQVYDENGKALPRKTVKWGSVVNTTNNKMELISVIEGLKIAEDKNSHVEIYSDSTYVVRCFTSHWIDKWMQNGWKTSGNTPVKNRDLWEELYSLVISMPKVTFNWVKGHADNPENELCDKLATNAIKAYKETYKENQVSEIIDAEI